MKFTPLALLFSAAVACGAAQAEPVNLTLSGASPGGLWSLVGAGIDRAAKVEDAGSVVTYQSTGGGFANIGLLSTYRSDLGLVHDAEAKIGLNGDAPFKEPIENLRSIGYLYNWAPMHFFLSKDVAEEYDIDSLDDIATSGAPLRIGINRSGNITSNVAMKLLAESGATLEVIEGNGGQIVQSGSSEQASLIKDGRIDMISNGIFVGHSSFRSVDENVEVVLLKVPEEAVKATNEEFGIGTMVIPAGSYKHQEEDVTTSTLGAMLITTDQADEETIHSLTSSMVNHLDEIRGVHAAMKALTPELLAKDSVLEFHPGAKRAYEEAGLIK